VSCFSWRFYIGVAAKLNNIQFAAIERIRHEHASQDKSRLEQVRVQLQNLNYQTQGGSTVPAAVMDSMRQFTKKNQKGTIDVWWLYDDGGETENLMVARAIEYEFISFQV
jgi:Solute carrier family 12